MKNFFKKLRPRKMDEMERHIAFQSQRNAYLFLVAALVVWSFYESWKVYAYHARLNLLPCGLLAGSALIQGLSQLVMARNAVKDDEDSYETEPLFRLIVLVCVIAGILAAAGAAAVLTGVRT